jgi:ribonuclease HIII
MIKDEASIQKIVEEIKKSMNLEELDELERQYNEMYQRLKSQQSGSTTKED